MASGKNAAVVTGSAGGLGAAFAEQLAKDGYSVAVVDIKDGTDTVERIRAAGGTAYGRMRPGITGPWQLDGRGETPFTDRVGFDEAYYRAQSLRGDLRMLLRTIGVVLNRTGT